MLGGSIPGKGMEALTSAPSLELVATDVSFGPLTALICDAHDIPFADESFDGLIVQAVLEHVVDPGRCAEEILDRVLKPNGVVYAETPFMQQVHQGRYDFTRFTHSGHRRLFRQFREIASGPVCGPGMALASARSIFSSELHIFPSPQGTAESLRATDGLRFEYVDHYLVEKPGALDGASGLGLA